MKKYIINFTKSAAKEYRKLPLNIKSKVALAVDQLALDPRPTGVKKLVGSNNLYRVRVGDYRIVYEIYDNQLIILITRLRHRKDVYKFHE